jgi:hypothetical protein
VRDHGRIGATHRAGGYGHCAAESRLAALFPLPAVFATTFCGTFECVTVLGMTVIVPMVVIVPDAQVT